MMNKQEVFNSLVKPETYELPFDTVQFANQYLLCSVNKQVINYSPTISNNLPLKEIYLSISNANAKTIIIPFYHSSNQSLIIIVKDDSKINCYHAESKEIKDFNALSDKIKKKYANYIVKDIPIKTEMGNNYHIAFGLIALWLYVRESGKLAETQDLAAQFCDDVRKELLDIFLRLNPTNEYIKLIKENTELFKWWNNSNKYGRFSENNTYEFLSNAKNYFDKIIKKLKELESLPNDKIKENTYVRMAFWTAEFYLGEDLTTEEINVNEISKLLKEVAEKGIKVKIILWNPGVFEAFTTFSGVLGESKKFAKNLTDTNNENIEIYFEKHSKSQHFGRSIHQKIVIFSINGKAEAIIGGLNLVDREYTFYDTAILVKGPSAFYVEQEWLRRWSKKSKEEIPHCHLYDQREQKDLVSVNIVTTNSELKNDIKDIQNIIIEKIKNSTKYIYLENYVLSDPIITDAIYSRLKEVPELKIIVMLAHPNILAEYGTNYINWLNYCSFLKFSLTNCEKIKTNNEELNRDDYKIWEPTIDYRGWLKDSFLKCELKSTKDNSKDSNKDRMRNVKFRDIEEVTCPTSERKWFFNPVNRNKYLHSKMMIIDDQFAIIGSANFSFRSMEYDGEISAVISDNTEEIKSIKAKLFENYGENLTEAIEKDGDISRSSKIISMDFATYKKYLHQFIVVDSDKYSLAFTITNYKYV